MSVLKIERVAQALYECPGSDFFPKHDVIMRPWDRADKEIKEHYCIMAKAAIEAYEADFGNDASGERA